MWVFWKLTPGGSRSPSFGTPLHKDPLRGAQDDHLAGGKLTIFTVNARYWQCAARRAPTSLKGVAERTGRPRAAAYGLGAALLRARIS